MVRKRYVKSSTRGNLMNVTSFSYTRFKIVIVNAGSFDFSSNSLDAALLIHISWLINNWNMNLMDLTTVHNQLTTLNHLVFWNQPYICYLMSNRLENVHVQYKIKHFKCNLYWLFKNTLKTKFVVSSGFCLTTSQHTQYCLFVCFFFQHHVWHQYLPYIILFKLCIICCLTSTVYTV